MSDTAPSNPDPGFARQLESARSGSVDDIGALLETFRGYLLVIANDTVEPHLASKAAPSDIVQETFLKAHQHFDQFRGNTPEELLGWLQKILANNVLFSARKYQQTGKRQLSRERSIDAGDSRFSQIPLHDPLPTPRDEAVAREDARCLKEAVNKLPPDYRQVVLLRNWERLTFAEVGQRLNRTPEAARKLWVRAVLRLREELQSAGALKDDSDVQLAEA